MLLDEQQAMHLCSCRSSVHDASRHIHLSNMLSYHRAAWGLQQWQPVGHQPTHNCQGILKPGVVQALHMHAECASHCPQGAKRFLCVSAAVSRSKLSTKELPVREQRLGCTTHVCLHAMQPA